MGKQLTKSADKRKPKHGLDAARPSASKKGQRDAATVSYVVSALYAPAGEIWVDHAICSEDKLGTSHSS